MLQQGPLSEIKKNEGVVGVVVERTPTSIQSSLIDVLRQEAQAISDMIERFPENAWVLVDRMLSTTGKVVFSGVGKSGLVAQKLAATCSSLGVPSFFLHPSDALHGDLGVVQKNDFFVALSKSGVGDEFDYIVPILRSSGVFTSLVCCSNGKLADKVDLVVMLSIEKEACLLNLAPTNSSTAMMAFGDAVAVVASQIKKFDKHEFARNHPAGALGKRLLWTVRQLMHGGSELPLIAPNASFKEVLVTITSKKLGTSIVVDEALQLKGIISDGDLRRACESGPGVFGLRAIDIATPRPKIISPDDLAFAALETMEAFNITSLVVVERDAVVGLVHIHDLIKAGIG